MNYKIILSALVFLLALKSCVMSQKIEYDKTWKDIDQLIEVDKQYNTALSKIEKLKNQAKEEKNWPEVVKAVIYTLNSLRNVEEDYFSKSADLLYNEINDAEEPAKSILNSMAADFYNSYFSNNRWKIYERTNLSGHTPEDPETWSATDFHTKIAELYKQSLTHLSLLKNTPVYKYEKIITKGNTPQARPTLFDILAYRALDYYSSDERTLPTPEIFIINNPLAFAEATEFINAEFTSHDSTSLHLEALHLLQQLLQFHTEKGNKTALIDADLYRLNFVNQYAVMADNNLLYEKALLKITSKYGVVPETAKAWESLINIYIQKGNSYSHNNDTSGRYLLKKAVQLGDSILRQTKAKEYNSIKNLLNEIKAESLSIHLERTNAVNKPFRMLVTYKNIDTLYLKVIKTDKKQKSDFTGNSWEEKSWHTLSNLPAINSFTIKLPATDDYQQHKVEIPVDALPAGEYVILASNNAGFSFSFNPRLAAGFFYVSDLSLIHNEKDFFVMNAASGKAIEGAEVKLWEKQYNRDKRENEYHLTSTHISGKNGYLKINAPKKNSAHYSFEISSGNDRLHIIENEIYLYRNDSREKIQRDKYEKENKTAHFFTDRGIYRPGQQVFFKGILMTKDYQNQKHKILPSSKLVVYLNDANGEQIDSLHLKSNDFGSFNGRFILPEGTLNGRFSITSKDINGHYAFSVEEYKRPKYFVELTPEQDAYKLNDTVTVKGKVEGYAGNALGGTKVSYRVIRKPIFRPFYFGFHHRYFPMPYKETEITNGITTSKADGSFEINFTALPDPLVNKNLQPVFHYEVLVNTTDISGEAGEASTFIPAGYSNIEIKIESLQEYITGNEIEIKISTHDLAGKAIPSSVHTAVYALTDAGRKYKERLWDAPDQFLLSKEEFHKLFPNDLYDEAESPVNMQKGKLIHSGTYAIKEKPVSLSDIPFETGWYKIEAKTIQNNGDSASIEYYIRVISNNSGGEFFLQAQAEKEFLQPGENNNFRFISNLDGLQLLYTLSNGDTSVHLNASNFNGISEWLSVKHNSNAVAGISISYAAVKNHRVYTGMLTVPVIDSSKQLDIAYTSFRDKILPGATETWTVKVKGSKGEKIAAEMLTAMYDKSLDQYLVHQWNIPKEYTNQNNLHPWQHLLNTSSRSYSKHRNIKEEEVLYKYYDQLNYSPGFYNNRMRYQYVYDMSAAPVAKQSIAEITLSDAKQEESGGTANEVVIRTNLRETAFFFPDLKTDAEGNISFNFTAPEALTTWKWMSLAHTKSLAFGYKEALITTRKELMVQPNAPRFLREGDKIDFKTRISNLTDKELTGIAELRLTDAETGVSIDGWFNNVFPNQYFTAGPGETVVVSFDITVPLQFTKPINYTVIAKAENHSDGEASILPVLTNRILVTETFPINLSNVNTKNIEITSITDKDNYPTANPFSLTLEFASNPAWYAVQALPYLKSGSCDCIDVAYNNFYSNAIAFRLTKDLPFLKEAIKQWKISDSSQFTSMLEKNQELKNKLLQATPWVVEAKTEAEQKRNLALLFDLTKMEKELASTLQQIKDWQLPEGAFSWLRGSRYGDRYMTLHIVTGLGKLIKANAIPEQHKAVVNEIVQAAISYLDNEIRKDYSKLVESKQPLKNYSLSPLQINYLYMRSFFPTLPIESAAREAYNFYSGAPALKWQENNMMLQAMLATYHYRMKDKKVTEKILASFTDNAIRDTDKGMYWKTIQQGYYWYESKLEAQATLINLFAETNRKQEDILQMKFWLLQNKQTNRWDTYKSTAEAIYALLTPSGEMLKNPPKVNITIGNQQFSTENSATVGTVGYIKAVVPGERINSEMGNISVSRTQAGSKTGPSWGAVYYQYFEEADKVKSSSNSGLSVEKQLFVEKNTPSGPQLVALKNNNELKLGDKIMVRIEIRADRDMEYVHMKDMRAPALEPGAVLSGYRWQDGLGYYQSVGDLEMNFYFNRLTKGTYVFEYPLQVTQTGTFNNGITTLQCYYAPEFSSHSNGIKLIIED